MVKHSLIFLALLAMSGCQEETSSTGSNALNEETSIEKINKTGTLHLIANRAMCPGQILDTSEQMKKHCNFTQIQQSFNIYDKKEKLIQVVKTKSEGELAINLPEGEYVIKNLPTPVTPLKETRVTLEAGKTQNLEINLFASVPQNMPFNN